MYESSALGNVDASGGITLPGRGIIVGKGVYNSGRYPLLLQHEYGHILQADKVGMRAYYGVIAKESLASSTLERISSGSWNHNNYWTETWANYLSNQYFGSVYVQSAIYPIQNISTFNYLRLLLY